MASPQKENGHVGIANEIVEALSRTNLNGYESRYLWVLFRKTYGWNKKQDIISNSQFSTLTGIKRTHIWRTQKTLITRNIVTKSGNYLGFNKDYTQWRELPKMVTVTRLGTGVTKSGNKKLPKMVHTKDTTKDTITKDISDVPSQDIQVFINLFKGINPSYERLFSNKTERASAGRLIKKYGMEKMTATLENLPSIIVRPYAPKITTPYELERNLGKLLAFVEQNKSIINKKKAKIAFV